MSGVSIIVALSLVGTNLADREPGATTPCASDTSSVVIRVDDSLSMIGEQWSVVADGPSLNQGSNLLNGLPGHDRVSGAPAPLPTPGWLERAIAGEAARLAASSPSLGPEGTQRAQSTPRDCNPVRRALIGAAIGAAAATPLGLLAKTRWENEAANGTGVAIYTIVGAGAVGALIGGLSCS